MSSIYTNRHPGRPFRGYTLRCAQKQQDILPEKIIVIIKTCTNQNGILNKCYVIRRKAGKRKQNEKQETKSELADVSPDTSIVTLEDRDRPGKSKARVTSTRSEETHFKSDKVNRWTGRRWRRPSTQTLTSEGRSGYVNGQSGLQDRKSPEAEGGMTRKKRVGPK